MFIYYFVFRWEGSLICIYWEGRRKEEEYEKVRRDVFFFEKKDEEFFNIFFIIFKMLYIEGFYDYFLGLVI